MRKIIVGLCALMMVVANGVFVEARTNIGDDFYHIEDRNEKEKEFYYHYERDSEWLVYLEQPTNFYSSPSTSATRTCTAGPQVVVASKRSYNWLKAKGTCGDAWFYAKDDSIFVEELEYIDQIYELRVDRKLFSQPFPYEQFDTYAVLPKGTYRVTKRAFDWLYLDTPTVKGWFNTQYDPYEFSENGVQGSFKNAIPALEAKQLQVGNKNVPIYQQIIPVRENARPGIAMKPEYVTIHTTANYASGANARAHANMQSNNTSRFTSWHYSVDDREIYQSIPINEIAFHAGDGLSIGNGTTVSIEIAENADGNYVQAELNAAYLTARLLYELDLPPTAVKAHYDWSGKDCPKPLLNGLKGSMGWANFKEKVEEIYYSFGSKSGMRYEHGEYYYYQNGVKQTSWVNLEGKWYYFDPQNNVRATGWQLIDGTWYYFYSDGIMAANTSVDGYAINSSGAASGKPRYEDGWQIIQGYWHYTMDSIVKKGLIDVGSERFYLEPSSGRMVVGLAHVDGVNRYFASNGAMMRNTKTNQWSMDHDGVATPILTYQNDGWLAVNGEWYYIRNGQRHTGWLNLSGTWYYLDPTTALMQTGWHYIDNAWYYFYSGGSMAANTTIDGWQINSSGAAVNKPYIKDGWHQDQEQWYYYINQVKQSGWLNLNGVKYYLDPTTTAMVTGWRSIDNVWYYFYANGHMATNTEVEGWLIDGNGVATPKPVAPAYADGWNQIEGEWYYYLSGQKQTSWVKVQNIWYYLSPDNGVMLTGWRSIDNVWYYFYANGHMATNTEIDGWIINGSGVASPKPQYQNGWNKKDGIYYYYQNDKLVTGWLSENGHKYYLDPVSGAMATGWTIIDGRWYYFYANGKMGTGWVYDGEDYYYLNATGDMKIGWYLEGSTWYYLEKSGRMQTGWRYIDNVWYYFYSSGAMATNTEIDGWIINGSGAARPK